MTDICSIEGRQTTLRIDDATYREAKTEAVRLRMTIASFMEEALRQRFLGGRPGSAARRQEAVGALPVPLLFDGWAQDVAA